MSEVRDLSKTAIDDERSTAGETIAPKTSGAPEPGPDTSKSDLANRDTGPRKAGATPRPTGTPVTGGERG